MATECEKQGKTLSHEKCPYCEINRLEIRIKILERHLIDRWGGDGILKRLRVLEDFCSTVGLPPDLVAQGIRNSLEAP